MRKEKNIMILRKSFFSSPVCMYVVQQICLLLPELRCNLALLNPIQRKYGYKGSLIYITKISRLVWSKLEPKAGLLAGVMPQPYACFKVDYHTGLQRPRSVRFCLVLICFSYKEHGAPLVCDLQGLHTTSPVCSHAYLLRMIVDTRHICLIDIEAICCKAVWPYYILNPALPPFRGLFSSYP